MLFRFLKESSRHSALFKKNATHLSGHSKRSVIRFNNYFLEAVLDRYLERNLIAVTLRKMCLIQLDAFALCYQDGWLLHANEAVGSKKYQLTDSTCSKNQQAVFVLHDKTFQNKHNKI